MFLCRLWGQLGFSLTFQMQHSVVFPSAFFASLRPLALAGKVALKQAIMAQAMLLFLCQSFPVGQGLKNVTRM